MHIGNGTFTSGNGHQLRGTFTLTRQANGVLFRTDDDFYFGGAPAPGWALCSGVPVDASDPDLQRLAIGTDFQRLTDKIEPVSGPQSGIIPRLIDIDAYDTVLLWCFQFPVILGFGRIQRF